MAAALAGCATAPAEERGAEAQRLMHELMSGRHAVGGPFTLWDPTGVPVSLDDFRGKLVLLYFGYATCPDVCPTDLAFLGQALRELGGSIEEVQPLFVSLDPDRDTPAVLREYAPAFHPAFVSLSGTEREIRRVATAYKVFFRKVQLPEMQTYSIDHTAYTFLLDRQGKFLSLFPPGTPSDRMVDLVRQHLHKPIR